MHMRAEENLKERLLSATFEKQFLCRVACVSRLH